MSSSSNSSGTPSKRSRHQPLIVVLAAAAAGILLDRVFPLPLWAWWGTAAAALAIWVLAIRAGRILGAGLAMLVAVGATAGAWHHCRWNLFEADELGRFARIKPEPVCIEALACNAPRGVSPVVFDPMRMMPPGDNSRLTVEAVAIRDGSAWRPVSGRAMLLAPNPLPEIKLGDRLRCFAKLSALPGARNPGETDRSLYYRSDRALCRLMAESPDDVLIVESGRWWTMEKLLERLRAHGRSLLAEHLDRRQAELASAVLLGLREELDDERNEAFLTTGTIHILSISGLHISILAGALFWLAFHMPISRTWAVASIAAITVLYAMMVDVEPPVVRATVLVLVACWALCFGREPLGMNSLAAAALVVLAINPAYLFHVGAQLSFLCMAGLILIAHRRPHAIDDSDRTLERLMLREMSWPQRFLYSFRKSVVGITLAGFVLWAITLPLIMARFHIVSFAGLILNVVLWLPATFGLLSGFCLLILGSICWPLGRLCGLLCNWSFYAMETCVDFAHRVPGSHFWFPGPGDWWLWGFYGGLAVVIAMGTWKRSRRLCAALLAAWILVGICDLTYRQASDRVDCTVLSVGHGCAVFLELPSGKTLLYDAGLFGEPSRGERIVSEFLWHRGLWHIDTIVLSHPDADHFNALPRLMKKFPVGQVCTSPAMFDKENRAVAALRGSLDDRGVCLREIRGGNCILDDENCRIEVLHPPSDRPARPHNADSIVLAVGYRGREIILPGDIESPGLDELLAGKPRKCAVLLAPHHGSQKSNSPGLAAWCKPRLVVFSGDGRWSLPEVESPYRAVGARVWHTFAAGAIHVTIDADGARASRFIDGEEVDLDLAVKEL